MLGEMEIQATHLTGTSGVHSLKYLMRFGSTDSAEEHVVDALGNDLQTTVTIDPTTDTTKFATLFPEIARAFFLANTRYNLCTTDRPFRREVIVPKQRTTADDLGGSLYG